MSCQEKHRLKHEFKIFLCHASVDRSAVRRLYQQLCTDGFRPWLAEEDLLPGQDWREQIRSVIGRSDVVMVCISEKSVDKEGYFQREIKLALDIQQEKLSSTTFIIPIRLEEVAIPNQLSQWQSADVFEEAGYEKLICALQARAMASGIKISNSSPAPGDRLRPLLLRPLFIFAASVAVLIGSFATYQNLVTIPELSRMASPQLFTVHQSTITLRSAR
jgi:hypothetical protein